MLSLTRAIIYLQGVSGFQSRPAPGSGSETLHMTLHNLIRSALDDAIKLLEILLKSIHQ